MPKLSQVVELLFTAAWNFCAIHGLMTLTGTASVRDSVAITLIASVVSLGGAWWWMRRHPQPAK